MAEYITRTPGVVKEIERGYTDTVRIIPYIGHQGVSDMNTEVCGCLLKEGEDITVFGKKKLGRFTTIGIVGQACAKCPENAACKIFFRNKT